METEIFYFRLLLAADDFGRFDARPAVLRARLYPLKEELRLTDVSQWTDNCQAEGLIILYAKEEKPYLAILNFNQRTRAQKSKFPPPLCKVGGQVSVIGLTNAAVDGDGVVIGDVISYKEGYLKLSEEEKEQYFRNPLDEEIDERLVPGK